jgi:fusaric acid resistance family protein
MPSPPHEPGPAREPQHLLAELRASQSYLTEGVSPRRWLDFGQFRWRDLAPGRAARATLGVLTPLALGIATGHVQEGTFAALGALPAGFVAFRGVTRTRVLAVVAAAAGMAVSTFVGATAAGIQPWLLVPVVMIWAYLVGLTATLGPTAMVVALQWPVALLIASALPLGPGPAALRAGLVLAGGLWQGALVVASWALSRGSAERAALAGSYRVLSQYARELAEGRPGPPPPATLPGTEAVTDPNPLMRTATRLLLVDLAREAERIRSVLTALGSAEGQRAFLAASARALSTIAEAIMARPAERGALIEQVRKQIDTAPAVPGSRSQWARDALLGQLRSSCRILGWLNDAEPGRPGGPPPRRGGDMAARISALQAVLLTLRASLGPSSEGGRHALRLAAVTGIAELLIRATGLAHGYWAVLTIFIVLRPDYSSTLYRGLQRAAGTLAGASLGVATALLAGAGSGALLVGISISLVAAYAVFTVNYLLYAIFMTDFVVVLLSLLGLPPVQTAVARLIGTGVGTGLALLAYVAWPTWEGSSANEKFARLFEAQGRYASALLRAYSRPDSAAGGLRGLKLAARRARSEAEASADRLADEPSRPPMTAELALALVSAGHRMAQAALTVDAAVGLHRRSVQSRQADQEGQQQPPQAPPPQSQPPPPQPQPQPQPQLDRLAAGLAGATRELARSLRTLEAPGRLPALRQLHSGLAAVRPGAGQDGDPLTEATDGLVDATDTAADILRRELPPG